MASVIHINQELYAIVDDEDYELVSRFKWYPRHTSRIIYAQCVMSMGTLTNPNKQVFCYMLLHRLIMRPSKDEEIDHRNHNGLDCRRANMRICNHQQNSFNRRSSTKKESSYKGVFYDKRNNNWRVKIKYHRQQIDLGRYSSEYEAALVYDRKAQELFGEYAFLNIPLKRCC